MISIQKKRTTDSIVAGVVSSLLLIACCIDAMFLLLEVGTRNSLTNNSKKMSAWFLSRNTFNIVR